MSQSIVHVKNIALEDELKYNGKTLLTYKIEYPEFYAARYQLSVAVINRYYMEKALLFQHRCRTELFDMAVEQYKDDMRNNFPVRVFEALLKYVITYSASCVISLYNDIYEYTGGAHGNTVRDSQTWNLQKCKTVRMEQLFTCAKNYREYILNTVEARIEENPEIYFADYKKLISDTFNENSFYCTEAGIVVYYQQYDIAPYSSGIREFLFPYSDCVLDPKKLCFRI